MDISKLFLWTTHHIITDQYGKAMKGRDGEPVVVYLRIIGDNDLEASRKYALRKSSMLRRKYRADTDQVLPDLSMVSRDELISLILLNETSTLYKQAERDTTLEYPYLEDDFSLEAEEKYAEARETYFERLNEKIKEKTTELVEQQKRYYQQFDDDRLLDIAVKKYIDQIIEAEMLHHYNDAILYYTVFKDEECTEKVFASIEDAGNASSVLKEQLVTAYSKLTLNDVNLKK